MGDWSRLARSWLARASRGHCGITTEGAEGQCDFGESGSFDSSPGSQLGSVLRSGNSTLAAAACLRRCASCRRCQYVSISLKHADCSWYAACDRGLTRFGDFVSHVAPGKAVSPAQRSWQPSWNSTCGAHALADSPLCALWGGSCGAAYPTAAAPHALLLRRWVACGGAASHRLEGARRVAGADYDPVPWYMGVTDDELLANAPVDWKSPALRRQWRSASSGCVTRRCIVAALSGRWITFAGDSTHREVYNALIGLLASRYRASYKRFGPTIGGQPTAESAFAKAQVDVDTVVTIPSGGGGGGEGRRLGESERLPRPAAVLVLSFRFLRGLDGHKLRLNALHPHTRFFYPSWDGRAAETPTHLVLSGDQPQHPAAPSPLSRASPDTFVFHSCAWSLPAVNRSAYYYPNAACDPKHARTLQAEVRMADGSAGRARVHGGACMPRGSSELTDEEIYEGFALGLNASLRGLRRWLGARTRVLVRGCHSGVAPAKGEQREPAAAHPVRDQTAELRRMDGLMRSAASGLCMPFLDVWALDEQAGFYRGAKADFHVPHIGSAQAALAMLLALTASPNRCQLGSS